MFMEPILCLKNIDIHIYYFLLIFKQPGNRNFYPNFTYVQIESQKISDCLFQLLLLHDMPYQTLWQRQLVYQVHGYVCHKFRQGSAGMTYVCSLGLQLKRFKVGCQWNHGRASSLTCLVLRRVEGQDFLCRAIMQFLHLVWLFYYSQQGEVSGQVVLLHGSSGLLSVSISVNIENQVPLLLVLFYSLSTSCY